jgi:hypothetical protein
MQLDAIILVILFLIIAGAFILVLRVNNKNSSNNENSQIAKGTVERFGYCNKTPKGWGYWVLKLKEQKEHFIIWPHLQSNPNEVALTTAGDQIEIHFYVHNNELIVSKIKNHNFKS